MDITKWSNVTFKEATAEEKKIYRFTKLMKKKLHLVAAVIILLIAKFMGCKRLNYCKRITYKLFKKEMKMTRKEFNDLQYNVFSGLDFDIPRWTNAEIAFYLATAAGLNKRKLEAVAHTLDYVEFMRDEIEKKVLATFQQLMPNCGVTFISTLHLLLATVAEVAHRTDNYDPAIIVRLSRLGKCPVYKIECIRYIIDSMLFLKYKLI